MGPCCGLAAIRMARSALYPPAREQAAAPAAASAEASPEAPAPAAVHLSLSAAAAAAPGVASPSAATMAMWGGLLGGSVELHLPGNATAAPGASVLHAAIERGFSSDGEVCAARACKLMRANSCVQTHACKLMRAVCRAMPPAASQLLSLTAKFAPNRCLPFPPPCHAGL